MQLTAFLACDPPPPLQKWEQKSKTVITNLCNRTSSHLSTIHTFYVFYECDPLEGTRLLGAIFLQNEFFKFWYFKYVLL